MDKQSQNIACEMNVGIQKQITRHKIQHSVIQDDTGLDRDQNLENMILDKLERGKFWGHHSIRVTQLAHRTKHPWPEVCDALDKLASDLLIFRSKNNLMSLNYSKKAMIEDRLELYRQRK